MSQIGSSPQVMGKNKKYLKPPPKYIYIYIHLLIVLNSLFPNRRGVTPTQSFQSKRGPFNLPSSVMLICGAGLGAAPNPVTLAPSGSSAGNCSEATYCKDGTVIAAITLGDKQQLMAPGKLHSHGDQKRAPNEKQKIRR